MDTSYLEHFKLKEHPYKLSPNPRYLYMTTQHTDAVDKCLYVIGQKGGLAAVYGEIGMGKTTIARHLYATLADDERYNVAMLITPALKTETALLKEIMKELEVETKRSYSDSKSALEDAVIEAHKAGKTTVIIIDEAQKLSRKMLDVVHSLHNFESDEEKLIQIVLIGQNELATNLEKVPEVADRVAVYADLPALTQEDAKDMIAFRWRTASGKGGISDPFNDAAIEAIYEFSRGLPRKIIKLCDLALLEAYAIGHQKVTADMVVSAAKDVRLQLPMPESVAV